MKMASDMLAPGSERTVSNEVKDYHTVGALMAYELLHRAVARQLRCRREREARPRAERAYSAVRYQLLHMCYSKGSPKVARSDTHAGKRSECYGESRIFRLLSEPAF